MHQVGDCLKCSCYVSLLNDALSQSYWHNVTSNSHVYTFTHFDYTHYRRWKYEYVAKMHKLLNPIIPQVPSIPDNRLSTVLHNSCCIKNIDVVYYAILNFFFFYNFMHIYIHQFKMCSKIIYFFNVFMFYNASPFCTNLSGSMLRFIRRDPGRSSPG